MPDHELHGLADEQTTSALCHKLLLPHLDMAHPHAQAPQVMILTYHGWLQM